MKALLLLLAISTSAMADDAALLHCRTIADVASRVACYDAIPTAASASAAAARATGPVAGPVSAPGATAATAATAAAATASAAPAAEKTFGLTATQMRKPDEPNSLQSSLTGTIDGWGPNTRFRLANGQVWRVADDSSASINEVDNPKVTITRNALGTMFLEIEGTRQAPRVRREQ